MPKDIIRRLDDSLNFELKDILRNLKSRYIIGYYSILNKVPPPKEIAIDPVNICNLRCPLCPTGSSKLNYKKAIMSFETFKLIINKIPSLKYAHLYHLGEPFLNPYIFKMISYAKKRNIFVLVHSNFNLRKKDDFFIDIVNSGLDRLYISLDGASQESYSRYRVGGNFNLVLSNIKTLIKVKNQIKSSNPKIIWKFIVNRFNENEVRKAKKIAHSLGVQIIFSPIGLGDDLPDMSYSCSFQQRKEYWLPKKKRYKINHYDRDKRHPFYNYPCPHLFTTLTVNPDGKVFPCFFLSDKENTFGDLLKDSLEDIWNNDKYNYSRSLFIKNKDLDEKIKTICSKCNNYKKSR